MGSRIIKVVASKRNRANIHNIALHNTSQLQHAKRQEATKMGWEPGLKGIGNREPKVCPPPHPHPHPTSLVP